MHMMMNKYEYVYYLKAIRLLLRFEHIKQNCIDFFIKRSKKANCLMQYFSGSSFMNKLRPFSLLRVVLR
jgi:hypothetical protein